MIANIAGNTPEDYCAMAERLSDSDVDMIEMNISCPNVKQGGVQFGTSCENAAGITAKVRRVCKKPLMVKFSPNVADIGRLGGGGGGCRRGCDSSSIPSRACAWDIRTRRPIIETTPAAFRARRCSWLQCAWCGRHIAG